MTYVVTALIDDLRLFVDADGIATDSPDKARKYGSLQGAERAAMLENREWLANGFESTWEAARLLPDGSVAPTNPVGWDVIEV